MASGWLTKVCSSTKNIRLGLRRLVFSSPLITNFAIPLSTIQQEHCNTTLELGDLAADYSRVTEVLQTN